MTPTKTGRYTYEFWALENNFVDDGTNWVVYKDVYVNGLFLKTVRVSHQVDRPNIAALNKTLDKLGKRAMIN